MESPKAPDNDFYKTKLTEIITNWTSENQENFLKIHYVFGDINIIGLWKEIYSQNDRKIKMDREMFERDIKTFKMERDAFGRDLKNFTLRNSPRSSNSDIIKSFKNNNFTNTEAQKNRIINFLVIALSHNYIDIELSVLSDIIKLMKTLGENSGCINALSVHFHQLDISNNKTPKRRSISSMTVRDVIQQTSTTGIEKTNSARSTQENTYRNFIEIPSTEIALEISIKYANIISNIKTKEIILAGMHDKGVGIYAPNYYNLIRHYERLTHFVYTDIVITRKSDKSKKASVKKFIEIAEKCLEYNNFLAFYAIISALSNITIQRIKNIWKSNSRHTKKQNEFEKLIFPGQNSANYRNLINTALAKNKKYIIPHLGMVVSDIRHLLENKIIDSNGKDFHKKVYDRLLEIVNNFDRIKYTNYITRCNNTKICNIFDNAKVCFDMNLLEAISIEYTKKNSSPEIVKNKITQALNESSNSITSFNLEGLEKISSSESARKKRLQSPRKSISKKSPEKDTIPKEKTRLSIDNNIDHKRRSRNRNNTKHISLHFENKPDYQKLGRKYNSTVLSMSIDKEFLNKLEVENWTIEQVACWLEKIKMEKYIPLFKKQEITGEALVELTYNDLKIELGIDAVGPLKIITKHLEDLKKYKRIIKP